MVRACAPSLAAWGPTWTRTAEKSAPRRPSIRCRNPVGSGWPGPSGASWMVDGSATAWPMLIGPFSFERCFAEIAMSNSAGIFQVDEGLGTKLRGTPLEEHIEVVARIEGEHEQRLVPIFRI